MDNKDLTMKSSRSAILLIKSVDVFSLQCVFTFQENIKNSEFSLLNLVENVIALKKEVIIKIYAITYNLVVASAQLGDRIYYVNSLPSELFCTKDFEQDELHQRRKLLDFICVKLEFNRLLNHSIEIVATHSRIWTL